MSLLFGFIQRIIDNCQIINIKYTHGNFNRCLCNNGCYSQRAANALTKMMKKKVIEKERMINAYNYFKKVPVKTIEVNIEKALEIAWDNKIYAYDACYLEAAKRLSLPLLTFDGNMIKVGRELGIKIIGGKNVNV